MPFIRVRSIVNYRKTGDIMPASADRGIDLLIDSKSDHGPNICRSATARERGRPAINHVTPDSAGGFILFRTGRENVSQKLGPKRLDVHFSLRSDEITQPAAPDVLFQSHSRKLGPWPTAGLEKREH
jgi:hypothetical protein